MDFLLKKVHRVTIPGLGKFAVVRDEGEARFAHGVIVGTHLSAKHFRRGRLYDIYDLGSGVITIGFVNAIVSTAVTPATNPFASYKYHDSGTGTTAATDGDTALQTQAGPATRATGTITNAQSATTGNHTAKLQDQGTISYTSTLAITEFGLFDQAAQGGNMADRRVFSALNVVSGDSIQFTYVVSIPSNN
jgi:hypothetical protein